VASSPTPASSTRRAWALLVGLGSFLALLVVGSCGGLMEFFGVPVSGSEFDPRTYEIRFFSYRASPFTGRQTSGLVRSTQASLMGEMLMRGSWLAPDLTTDHWDLISDSTVNRSPDWLAADWGRLVQEPQFVLGWETWSQSHPQAAAILWPAVSELGREGCYDEIVPLLETVNPKPPRRQDLLRLIDQRLAARYRAAADESTSPERSKHFLNLAEQPFSKRLANPTANSDDEQSESEEPSPDAPSDPCLSWTRERQAAEAMFARSGWSSWHRCQGFLL